jgi:tetratricopeptide (TPR) repeat protein
VVKENSVSREKLSRKEMKSPDVFLRGVHNAGDWLAAHQKPVVVGMLALIAGVLIVSLVVHFQNKKVRESANSLGSAISVGMSAVETADSQLAGSEGETDTKKFATYREKEKVFVKALQEVNERHPQTVAAKTSALVLAGSQMRSGKLDQAVSTFQKYLGESANKDPLRINAWEGLGYAFEAKKDWAQALEAFASMGKESNDQSVRARAAYHRARILEEKGMKPEAASAFSQVKEEFKATSAATDSSSRLALLGLEGIFPVSSEKAKAKPVSKPKSNEK